jgi:hypothetical protein
MADPRTELERKFEELFETELPEKYEVDIRVRDLEQGADAEPQTRRLEGLKATITSDHCGSQTSSTLTMEFFVAISEGAWMRADA